MTTTTTTTANNNTNNMSNVNVRLYALANMLFKGRGFCIVQKHDGRGGWYHEIEPLGYKCYDFEYVEWEGTPMRFAKEEPTFTTHVEPFHGEPLTFSYTATEMVEMELENRK